MVNLPVKTGISSPIVTNIPEKWSREWMRNFVAHYLNPMDIRSATPLQGLILTTAGPTKPASLGPGQINPTVTPTQVSGTQQGVLPLGNVMPMVQNGVFTYTSTTSQIVFTWPSYVVYRPDGVSTVTIAAGSETINGLSPSTTYNCYVYSPESDPTQIMFAPGLVGTPQVLFDPTATYAQLAQAFAYASQMSNIFQGKLTAATPASGSGGGGGGGGGFNCPHPEQPILTPEGYKPAKELKVGDTILTPDGWTPILYIHPTEPRKDWIFAQDSLVTPQHRFVLQGELVEAHTIGIKVEILPESSPVGLEIAEPHLYYMYGGGPLSHNLKP